MTGKTHPDEAARQSKDGGEMPRTLIVDLAVRYGGVSSRVLSLLGGLPAGRAALAGLAGSAITRRAQALGLAVHTVGASKADPRIVGRLARVIRDGGYQVLDTQNVQSKLWGSLAAARTGAALVSTLHSWYEDEHGGSLKGRIYQTIERLTSRSLDLTITVSSQGRERALASGVPQEAIALILNAVEIDPESVPGDRAWLSRTFDLPDDAITCCAVGRLVQQKGYSDLVEAIGLMRDEHPSLYCLIVGEGRYHDELAGQIAAAGLEERVRLSGFQERDKVLSIVKTGDIFVMPSRSEGTPVALLEAAALARPILATRVGGIPEMVTDGEQALLVEPGDGPALAAGLRRLCDDPALATRLGAQARERVDREFGLGAQIEATQRAYREAWARSRRRLADHGEPGPGKGGRDAG
jgi:glycosyltransferase involved in cell wall biosynthesis